MDQTCLLTQRGGAPRWLTADEARRVAALMERRKGDHHVSHVPVADGNHVVVHDACLPMSTSLVRARLAA